MVFDVVVLLWIDIYAVCVGGLLCVFCFFLSSCLVCWSTHVKHQLTRERLISLAADVTAGMSYLSARGYVVYSAHHHVVMCYLRHDECGYIFSFAVILLLWSSRCRIIVSFFFNRSIWFMCVASRFSSSQYSGDQRNRVQNQRFRPQPWFNGLFPARVCV